jgi:hypothetical protein
LSTHVAAAEAFVSRDTAANHTLREYRSDWESKEEKYHELAVQDLNAKTRSYNTIAPYTARKTYTKLQQELEDCYKDVAPQIVHAIRARETDPPPIQTKPLFRGVVGMIEDLTSGKQDSNLNRHYDHLPHNKYSLREFFSTFKKLYTR